MIVQCSDGWFYKDPTWIGPKTVVLSEYGDLWLYYQSPKALKDRAMRGAAKRMGFDLKRFSSMFLPLQTIIGEKMVVCSASTMILKSAPPTPSHYVAKIQECPQESVTETVLKW